MVGILASTFALWARYGLRWWPASPLEKAAYYTGCPACPIDVAARRPETHSAMAWVLLCATLYALIGIGIEAARRMRRGESSQDS